MKLNHFVRGFVLLAIVTATSWVASTPRSSDRQQPAAGAAGMKVYLDPETGELQAGPAAAAQNELDVDTQNAVRRDTEGLTLVRHANGAVSMDLQGRYQSVATIRIDENGVATFCDDNGPRVDNDVRAQATAATPEVK